MLAIAVANGADPETLSRLMDLMERVQKSQAESAFNKAMQEFQSSCPPILKNAKAAFNTKSGGSASYTFATLDHIAETIRPLLKQLGLSYEFNARTVSDVMAVDCVIHHVEGHKRTSTFEVPIDRGNTLMSKPQQAGSALTFCRRYALTMALGICTADVDTDAANRGRKLRDMSSPNQKPVTAEELLELEAEWVEVNPDCQGNRGAFLAWCANVLRIDNIDALKTPKGWNPQDLAKCWNELK